MHGLPGCRLEAAIFDDIAKEVGARIIAVERPGCGLSDPQPGWTVRGFPGDVEVLARALRVGEFGVLVCLLSSSIRAQGGPSFTSLSSLPASEAHL